MIRVISIYKIDDLTMTPTGQRWLASHSLNQSSLETGTKSDFQEILD